MMFLKKYVFIYIVLFIAGLSVAGFSQQKKAPKAKKTDTKKQVPVLSDSLLLAETDTVIAKTGRRPAYRVKDNPAVLVRSPLLLKDPQNAKRIVGLQPSGQMSDVKKVAGEFNYGISQNMSFQEYSALQNKRVANSLWREYAAQQDGKSAFSGRGLRPSIEKSGVVDRIFGGDFTDFKPNGFVTLDFGLRSDFTDNPNTSVVQRKQVQFDFNEQINLNFNGKVGQNLGFLTNLDTKSAFNFQNKIKLNYQPKADVLQKGLGDLKNAANTAQDIANGDALRNRLNGLANTAEGMASQKAQDVLRGSLPLDPNAPIQGVARKEVFQGYSGQSPNILQKLDAGHVSMPINSQLIPGVQNLFGVKTQLRFGKLDVTAVAANQQSKGESFSIRGGSQSRTFELPIALYDENRHFFLAHFFRDNYERSLKNLPVITSGVNITRIEVYVTNRTASYETMRNLAAFSDLGEGKPYISRLGNKPQNPADNKANNLFGLLQGDKSFRQVDRTNSVLSGGSFNLQKGQDFEVLRGARRLMPERDFRFHAELGYISLNTALRNDEILAVAFEYSYQGKTYQVGELSEDYAQLNEDEVVVLKLLKSSTIRNRLDLPMWNLMMKNVYSLNTTQVTKQGFQLRVIYKDDQTGIDNPTLQEGRKLQNKSLIRVLGLDRLNSQNDPQPDGNFDFVEGTTIDSRNGKLIFPVLEPFGSHLARQFETDETALKEKYVFNELYRTTQRDAEQISNKTKFFIRGSFQSASGTEFQLPPGVETVTISAGGVPLMEGQDYTIDPQIGRVKITNSSILNSGKQIDVQFERPDMFNNQVRTMLGTRLDYNMGPNVHLGATAMSLRENPINRTTRVALGSEPVNNKIVGFDASIRKDSRFLTRLLDKLPFVQTKEVSSIQFMGEIAKSFAGVSKTVNNNAMIDDFESTRNTVDFARQPRMWRLGATPADQRYNFHSPQVADTLRHNFKRAKIAVYNIDQTFFGTAGFDRLRPENISPQDLENHYERPIYPQEIFSNRSVQTAGLNLPSNTLDISYFPSERGMYNYNPDLELDGRLKNPRQNFGAITRAVSGDIDFDNANVEYLDFWLLDPFIQGKNGIVLDGSPNPRNNTTGGKLLIHLGDASEDVVPDGRNNFENGLPFSNDPKELQNQIISKTDSTIWGRVSKRQFLVDAFTNQDGSRPQQDVGLDGLNNANERRYFSNYLRNIRGRINADAYKQIEADPSADDFEFAFSTQADQQNRKMVARYKNYLGMENNSPADSARASNGSSFEINPAISAQPDKEDANNDNTINEVEAYYEYEIDLQPSKLDIGRGYVVDKVIANSGAVWYQFRVPIKSFARRFGDIQGFKSVRFMRLVMTDFEQPAVLRFAQMQLTANQYRVYNKDLNKQGLNEVPEPYNAQLKVATVSLEENGTQSNGTIQKSTYVLPPGVQRDRDISQQQLVEFNEQSLSLCVTGLRDGDSRGVFKNTRLDLQNYERLQMFIHHENSNGENSDMRAGIFMRLGTDLNENYYEIELPRLKTTPIGSNIDTQVWPTENNLDVALDDLRKTKLERNKSKFSLSERFTVETDDKRFKITVVGNPDLSAVMTLMLGVKNPKDDDAPLSFCVWLNEFRANGFKKQGDAIAAIMSANVKLADIAQVVVNGGFRTFGYGGVQQKIAERDREDTRNIGVSANIALDKFTPEKWGLRVPLFVNYEKEVVAPHFDPLDPDMKVEDKIFDDAKRKDEYKQLVQEQETKKGINLSNIRKVKTNENAKNHFYDIENFSATYAHTNQERSSILLQEYKADTHKGGLTYAYNPEPRIIEPFKDSEKLNKPWLFFLKDFNFSPIPSVVAVRADFDRYFAKTQLRGINLSSGGESFFEKYLLMNRQYDLQWNLTKSLLVNYGASVNAIADEPEGELNDAAKKTLWNNLKQGGRAKLFDQKISTTYRFPFDKFQALDWISADGRFVTSYNYTANSFDIQDDVEQLFFGNLMKNNREQGIQGRIDFVKAYNKVKNLRLAQQPNIPKKNIARNPGDDEEITPPPSNTKKSILRVLTTIRGINYNIAIEESTTLPGFLDAPRLLGLNKSYSNSDFAKFSLLGSQNRTLPEQAAERNLLSRTQFNPVAFSQTRRKRLDYNTNLEPFNGFRMNIRANLSRGDRYQSFYRFDSLSNRFRYNSPVRSGEFSMSFWSFKTAFNDTDQLFATMQSNRDVIIQRLSAVNRTGENRYSYSSQDVLIPAFFAAYNGKDAKDVRLNPFKSFPMPNWDINYTSLGNLPIFKPYFSSMTLSHSYKATYSVGAFTSNLDYGDLLLQSIALGNLNNNSYDLGNLRGGNQYNYPISTLIQENKVIPVFDMTTITLQERFAPMIGLQFTTKGKMTGRVEYNRDRTVRLVLDNMMVGEDNNNDFVFSLGYKKNNFKLPFRVGGEVITLKNDLNFTMQVQVRDNISLLRHLVRDAVKEGVNPEKDVIRGDKVVQIRPSVQYMLNKAVNLDIFFEKFVNTPHSTNSYYIRRSNGGVRARINLAELL